MRKVVRSTDNNHMYHGTYLLEPSERGGHAIRTCLLTVNGTLLPITPPPGMKGSTAYDWLPGGNGCTALAYTLLANEVGPQLAAELHHAFERDVIAYLPRMGSASHWELTSAQIYLWRQLYGEVQSLLQRVTKFEANRPLWAYA